ncbi:DUF4129 domain-containing protein [Marinirhabdus gelatinilytica]|uniref:Uncharacterized protein DUF4129 n=1 Tax=Marinirhabdus gelatinilytica TaxID=1703343 RepID=A0A370QFE2_9FLAO|nr:DUF4129 domain-containing protein [Marinirhabdus gelatinilytica]RDK87081.1 uncharacterized protein DUF4129 [Marinirhabdus gelatinilytica]
MNFRFCIILVLLMANPTLAQDTIAPLKEQAVQYDTSTETTPLPLNEEKVEEYKNNPDFNYAPPEETDNWWKQFTSWIGNGISRFFNWLGNVWRSFWEWLLPNGQGSPFWGFAINILPYIIITILLAFVVWLFYKLNPGAKLMQSKEKPDVFFTEEEEIIKTRDIQKLIDKALANNNYRLAVRYYYLLILKRLTDAELIEYEFDKTNSDYFAEIASENLNTGFRKATNIYDYIWYGNFTVTETDFNKAQTIFNNLEKSIHKAA